MEKPRKAPAILAIRGTKDKKLRRVEHIPVDMSIRRKSAGPYHYWMRLWVTPRETVITRIAHSRVEKIKGLERLSELRALVKK